jgi:hypothetical protein
MESFFSSFGPRQGSGQAPGPAADAGVRVKVMRWPASLRLGHTTILDGKAIQISASGVGLLLARSVRDGEIGLVRVDAFINGNPVLLQTRVSVVCCTCVGMEGFRISLRFESMDEDALNALDALLNVR